MSGSADNEVKDTPQMKYLASVAADTWNFSQENLKPLQAAYMDKVESMDDSNRKSFVSGKANLGQQGAATEAYDQVTEGGSSRGLDLGSGKMKGAMTDIALGSAETGGQVSAQAEFSQDSQYIKGLQNIVDIGSGQETQAVAGLADVAQVAGQNARSDAVNSFNRRSANLQTIGTLAGAATRWGTQPATPSAGYSGSAGNLADGNLKSIGW